MFRHLLRRLLLAVPLVLAVATLTFALLELAPGDTCDTMLSAETPRETEAIIRLSWGCDRPVYVRYAAAMRNLLTFQFGESAARRQPVAPMIADALPNTFLLSLLTVLVAQVLGSVVGVVQAARQFRLLDTGLSILTLTLYSIPTFWLGLMLQLVFSVWWPILPLGQMSSVTGPESGFARLVDMMWHLVLPGVAMGLAAAAGDARFMRSSMIEVIRQDFIRTARAKGLSEWRVLTHHALRNALLPTLTLLGLNLPFLVGGSVVVEHVFSWPGMGSLIVDATMRRDAPVLMACFYVYSVLVVLGGILSDVLVQLVDPRIRWS